MTLLCDFFRQIMDKGIMTGAVLADRKKAYRKVNHTMALSKLPLYGINGEELK